MALLVLAHHVLGDTIEVATVDHRLRPEAADECALVARICKQRRIPCRILTVNVDAGNVQAVAREARYEALGKWAQERGLAGVATAHHAEDQAETLLMRLNRGSGLAGLVGIRNSMKIDGCAVPILRPLLGFRRVELRAITKSTGMPFVDDPSNRDESYDRVRVRNKLAGADWLDIEAIGRSARLLAQAEEFLTANLAEVWAASVEEHADTIRYHPGLSHFEHTEILVLIFERMGLKASRSDLARVAERLRSGENANLAGILAKCTLDPDGRDAERQRWDFQPEPPRSHR